MTTAIKIERIKCLIWLKAVFLVSFTFIYHTINTPFDIDGFLWNVQMAGAFLAALPTLLVYIFLGHYFLRGLIAGALKG